MNKNIVLAFSLMLLVIIFFNSDFYYNKILHQPRPSKNAAMQQVAASVSNQENNANVSAVPAPVPAAFTKADTGSKLAVTAPVSFDTIWIENDKYLCGISEQGARIISLKMKNYFYHNSASSQKEMIELIDQSSSGGANLTINGQDFDGAIFAPSISDKKVALSNAQEKTILFVARDANNIPITKRFTFFGNDYKIKYEVLSNELDGKSVTVGWKGGISESEAKYATTKSVSGVAEPHKVHINDTKSVDHIQLKKPDKDEETGFYKWTAITSKYFMVALVADSVRNTDLFIQSYDTDTGAVKSKSGTNINYQIQMRRASEGPIESYWIFAGPSQYSLIKSYKVQFQKVLFGGWEWLIRADLWFPFICEITLWLLIFLDFLFKDYGITILVLTIILRLVTLPLSHSSMKSMSRMKDVQPKINHLRDKHKANPRKMNEEIMALYKKEGVNPFNPGCLPMFLQMPVLFALFIVLRKAIELRGAGTVLLPWVKDLSQPESLFSLTGIFPGGIPIYGSSFALLPVIMAILTFFQNKMTITDPNQKMMIYFMPVFMLVLFNNFPAGLVLYWTFSNALGIVQQAWLNKRMKTNAQSVLVTAPAPVKHTGSNKTKKR